jgi:hypothetical protein
MVGVIKTDPVRVEQGIIKGGPNVAEVGVIRTDPVKVADVGSIEPKAVEVGIIKGGPNVVEQGIIRTDPVKVADAGSTGPNVVEQGIIKSDPVQLDLAADSFVFSPGEHPGGVQTMTFVADTALDNDMPGAAGADWSADSMALVGVLPLDASDFSL